MSVAWTNRVWDASRAKGTHLLVLLAIADNADAATGIAWPSVAYLMKKTRLSERPVQRALHSLAALGEIAIVQRTGRSNHYRLTITGGVELTGGRIDGGAETPGGGGGDAGSEGAETPPRTVSEPSRNQGSARRARLPAVFPLTTELQTIAIRAGCKQPHRLFDAFCDYWRASGETKLDWVATFRTWARRAHGGPPGLACGCGGLPPSTPQPRKADPELERIKQRERELGLA